MHDILIKLTIIEQEIKLTIITEPINQVLVAILINEQNGNLSAAENQHTTLCPVIYIEIGMFTLSSVTPPGIMRSSR